ncbi:MAG: fibronectin type III domain-containing protein, partial [Thermodesulfobacteriota bacterium]
MKFPAPKKDHGFTLVELLVAMALSIIVLGALYSLYINFIRTSAGQDKIVEIQQEGRAAIERISKEVRAAGCYYRNTPIITATATEFEFESDTDPDPALGPWKIKYNLDTTDKELQRSSAAWTGSAYGAYSAAQTVAGHITGLSFAYYDETGTVIPAPITSQANRDRIRRVDAVVTATTDEINPSTKKFDSITLTTSLYLRCMGVQQSTDTTECAVPTDIQVADPGICGRLNVTWTKSTSSDAAGYRIYYRPTGTSFYSGLLEVPGGATEAYTMTGLQDGVQYDIAMKCYDTAGNINAAYAGPVTGTASPTDTKPDDSVAPELPTATDATAADGSVTLTWTGSTSVDVGGYNVYRSDDGGSVYTKVTEVDSTFSSYSDTTVTNCPTQPYYYKVTSWDCAANEKALASQSAVYGDAALVSGITDVPTDGTTDTNPTETTPPADPLSFQAVAGADKIYLSYATPVDTDLQGVRILRRQDIFPTDKDDAAAVGPNGTKDYSPLTPNQTYSLIDSAGVVIGDTYYYRAFAYDGCMNFSPGTISQATAKPCGDGAPGSKHYGPPSAPTGLSAAVCSTSTLSWTASAGSENGNTFNPASENDVVGYNVYRSTTSGFGYTQLNAAPITSTSYADATVVAGNTYYYVVKAVDCAANESTVASSEVTVIPSGIDWDPAIKVISYGSAGVTGTQHNVVKLGLQNLGNTDVTINSATMTWTTAAALIKTVKLKPFGGSDNTLWNDTTLPLTSSGVNIDYSSYEPDAALRRLAAGSTLNEMTIDFRDSTDSAAVDMRNATINITIYYTNDSSSSACTSSTFSVPVPRGPVITASTQNQPVSPTTSNLNTGTLV